MNRRATTLLYAVITILLGFLGSALLAEGILRLLPVARWPERVRATNDDRLVRLLPGTRFLYSTGWNFSTVNRGRVNNAGFVNDQDYEPLAPTPLLAVVGDSYVEALIVPYDSSVQGRLQNRVNPVGRVYSFGISGAPLSQYLYLAEHVAHRYRPQALAVVVVGNDFDESLMDVGFIPGYHYFRERPEGDYELVWRPDPDSDRSRGLRRFFKQSALVRYTFSNLSVMRLVDSHVPPRADTVRYVGSTLASLEPRRLARSKRAVDAFLSELPRRSGLAPERIVLVMDGARPQLYSPAALAEVDSTFFSVMRRYLLERARAQGFEAIDLEPQFVADYRRNGRRFEFPKDAHWNGRGHAVSAEAIAGSRVFARTFPAGRADARSMPHPAPGVP